MPNLDLLNSALDLAGEQALHNARICGADAHALAAELLENIKWAKRVLATAADGGYDRHDIDPADALRDHLRDRVDYPAGAVVLEEDSRKIIQDPQGVPSVDFDDNLPF